MANLEELKQLNELRESGVLTEEEFQKEKTKILNGENNNSSSKEDYKEIIEIKGDFPLISSKVSIDLMQGEKVIIQNEATALTGAGGTAVNGFITLTSRRIIFNKKTTGKSFLGTGLLGVALAAGNKDVDIKLDNISSIESKKIRMTKGLEIITKDGFAHRYINIPQNIIDVITELIKTVI